jgi:hypothetical protein
MHFVSEAILPDASGVDPSRLALGEPAVPRAFTWRDRRYEIAGLVSTWRTYKTDRGEKYVDRHWFEIDTAGGERMRIYCERRRRTLERWWLFSIEGGKRASASAAAPLGRDAPAETQ